MLHTKVRLILIGHIFVGPIYQSYHWLTKRKRRVHFWCPWSIPKCRTAYSWKNIWVQFYHWHPWYSIVILEEVNQPHPRCPQCATFSPEEALNHVQPTSVMFWRRTEKNLQRLVVDDTEERMERVFLEYGTPLTAVPLFKYFGKMLLSSEND